MLIGIDASRAFIKEKTGTESYSSNLIQKLIEIDRKNQYRLYVQSCGGEVRQLAGERRRRRVEVKRLPWFRFWTQGGLALECFLHSPDILFIPAHTLPVIRRSSLKTVVTIHGLEYEYLPQYYQFPQKLYLNKSTEYAVRHATHLIAVSKWTKKQLVERLGARPKKISVVYEAVPKGVTPRQRPHSRKGFPLEGKIADKPYVFFVGTIQPRKNLVRLIEAFAKVLQFFSSSVLQLIIVGKLGWMYEEILQAPKKFGVGEKVKFLGYVSDEELAALYSNALFFVLPSLCEGFGLPILEAMAAGCPIIASKAGALPEIAGDAALLINPKNVGEIVGAMKLMIENQELREALREKGFRRVRQFSWQKAAFETIKVFKKVYPGESR